MCKTFTCVVSDTAILLRDCQKGTDVSVPKRDFDNLIERRQRAKWSLATRLAGGLYAHFSVDEVLTDLGSNPRDTPLVIFNRHANWDYVAQTMCDDTRVTLDGVNNYVATAWFPASVQGYLTIEHHNTAEAITIATDDVALQAATVESLFKRDSHGRRTGAVLVGTFEAIPARIGTQTVEGTSGAAFGAFSLISDQDGEDDILAALMAHKELYRHATA